jgi:hypothetical protein
MEDSLSQLRDGRLGSLKPKEDEREEENVFLSNSRWSSKMKCGQMFLVAWLFLAVYGLQTISPQVSVSRLFLSLFVNSCQGQSFSLSKMWICKPRTQGQTSKCEIYQA